MPDRASVSALVIGIMVAAVSIVAAGVAWWRWERIGFVAGGIPLPPGTEVVRVVGPESSGKPCTVLARNRRSVESLQEFFRSELETSGWRLESHDSEKARFRRGRRILRLVFHPEPKKTVFTVNVNSCPAQ